MDSLHHRWLVVALVVGLVPFSPPTASAWTTESRIQMASMALRVAPPDLVGQIEKHKKKWQAGIRAAAKSDPTVNANGDPTSISIALVPLIETEVDRAIAAIVEHKPFDRIVFQLGVVAYWVAATSDPLLADDSAKPRPEYWQDYSQYLESATQRFSVLYYPHGRQVGSPDELETLLHRSITRSSGLAPRVADEYRRIASPQGVELFDDRSTAFGVGSLAFSHGVSDITGVLRYIWIRAGGADTRGLPVLDEDHLILVGSGSDIH